MKRQEDDFSQSPSRLEEEFAKLAGAAAWERVQELQCRSRLPTNTNRELFYLTWNDITVEGLLGVGGFGCVCLTTIPKLTKHRQRKLHHDLFWPGSSSSSHHHQNHHHQRQHHQNPPNVGVGEGHGGSSTTNDSFDTFLSDDSWACSADSADMSTRSNQGTHNHTNNNHAMHTQHSAEDDATMEDPTTDVSKYYALKCLNQRTMSNQKHFTSGAKDLASEAFLLSRLSHDNIIQIYGVTAGSIADAFLDTGGYFLILEALNSTLQDLMKLWKAEHSHPSASVRDFFSKKSNHSRSDAANKKEPVPSIEKRLSKIAMGIVHGMEYLHQHNIVFRDLKPQNVGFAADGTVRLLDFGLARELSTAPPDHVNDDGYPTMFERGIAGSLRYMAPETMLHQFCTFSSDVFGFGVLLWELVTLHRPHEKLNKPSEFKKAVAVAGLRPSLRVLAHLSPLKHLIQECWASDWRDRPNFFTIRQRLQDIQLQLEQLAADGNGPTLTSSTSGRTASAMRKVASFGNGLRKKSRSGGMLSSLSSHSLHSTSGHQNATFASQTTPRLGKNRLSGGSLLAAMSKTNLSSPTTPSSPYPNQTFSLSNRNSGNGTEGGAAGGAVGTGNNPFITTTPTRSDRPGVAPSYSGGSSASSRVSRLGTILNLSLRTTRGGESNSEKDYQHSPVKVTDPSLLSAASTKRASQSSSSHSELLMND